MHIGNIWAMKGIQVIRTWWRKGVRWKVIGHLQSASFSRGQEDGGSRCHGHIIEGIHACGEVKEAIDIPFLLDHLKLHAVGVVAMHGRKDGKDRSNRGRRAN